MEGQLTSSHDWFCYQGPCLCNRLECMLDKSSLQLQSQPFEENVTLIWFLIAQEASSSSASQTFYTLSNPKICLVQASCRRPASLGGPSVNHIASCGVTNICISQAGLQYSRSPYLTFIFIESSNQNDESHRNWSVFGSQMSDEADS